MLVPDSANLCYGLSMALLPDRHPQKDFFILDIADVVPKDDTATTEIYTQRVSSAASDVYKRQVHKQATVGNFQTRNLLRR